MILCKSIRTCFLACSTLMIGASAAISQEVVAPPAAPTSVQTAPATTDCGLCANSVGSAATCSNLFNFGQGNSSLLVGTHGFDNFIGFISNPMQNIDPRAITEIYPIFASAWTSEAGPVPASDFQLYGAGLTVALSDRLAIGLNQGGYADVHLSRADAQLLSVVGQLGKQAVLDLLRRDPSAVLALLRQHGLDVRELQRIQRLASIDPTLQFSDTESGGDRSGWLNLGGFAQYTLIEDVPDQFLLTAGLRVEAPCGSHDIYQGHGPAHLAPYVTVGQGWCDFHLLATTGYYFPAGPGSDTSRFFYADLHMDRQCFGWLYPLIEFNWIEHTTTTSLDLPARRGFFDLNNFESSGNILTMAVGANVVLIPAKLEFGAVYLTSIASQHDFNVDGLMVKMVYRY